VGFSRANFSNFVAFLEGLVGCFMSTCRALILFACFEPTGIVELLDYEYVRYLNPTGFLCAIGIF
jgi:hypothetical protein